MGFPKKSTSSRLSNESSRSNSSNDEILLFDIYNTLSFGRASMPFSFSMLLYESQSSSRVSATSSNFSSFFILFRPSDRILNLGTPPNETKRSMLLVDAEKCSHSFKLLKAFASNFDIGGV